MLAVGGTGCASRGSVADAASVMHTPTTYCVLETESISEIARRFYGAPSDITTHCLWDANPEIRNLESIQAGRRLTIPVLPDQSVSFLVGEIVHLYPTSIADPPYGVDAVIGDDGSVKLPLGIIVRVAGYTPDQACKAIEKAYVPRHVSRWEMAVMRVQVGPANRSQPIRAETNRTSAAAGSDR